MTDILIKRGIGKPASLSEGELAIDTSTGMLYSLVGGVVTELNEPPEDVDLSDYVDKTKQNDVAEGQFRLVWDHSYDIDFPFNGSIGYDGNNDDPDSVGGSFLYAKGTRGTVSIGRDGDMELHGPSEIKGMPDREGNLPWITNFEYVQAADFRDADGNSIVGGGADLPDGTKEGSTLRWNGAAGQWEENKYLTVTDDGVVTAWEFVPESGRVGWTDSSYILFGVNELIPLSSDKMMETGAVNLGSELVKFNDGWFEGAVRASDFLDLEGNPIGGGFSGDYNDLLNKPTIPTNNNQLTNGAGYTTETWVNSQGFAKGTIPTNNNQLTNGAGYVTNSFVPTAVVNGEGGVSVGGAYGFGGITYYLYPTTADGFNFDSKGCLGDGSRRWSVVHAETYYKGGALLPSVADMADVFRTLQTAIADEEDPAAMKEALVNALGGLIEQFEGYERADP